MSKFPDISQDVMSKHLFCKRNYSKPIIVASILYATGAINYDNRLINIIDNNNVEQTFKSCLDFFPNVNLLKKEKKLLNMMDILLNGGQMNKKLQYIYDISFLGWTT